ncbi:MAG: cation-translocating P-type ATPase [Candidatus Heimdallarchaeota archaeon]|nr:cation-translocating P-type ATPase [Candidatus Heimdallarchaeota archaeon]
MSSTKLSYKVIGIDCAGCGKTLEKKLLGLKGVLDVRINIVFKKIYFEIEPDKVTEEQIKSVITKAGYSLYKEESSEYKSEDEIQDELERRHQQSIWRSIFKKKELYTIIVSGLLLMVGALLQFAFVKPMGSRIAYIFGMIIGGVFIFRKAFFSLKGFKIDINILMTVAAIGAIILGEDIEATSIVFLFSIAELAENISVESAKNSIESLINYAPSKATLETKDGEIIVPATSVKINSHIIVKVGERIPLDGVIFSGKSYINQAPITGESMPILKTKGDEVFAGTLCEDGALTILVTKKYEDIFLRKIVELVENSDQRAPIDRFIDNFAKYYTPIMFLVALITAFIPPLFGGGLYVDNLAAWVKIALVILVISCPCAVVLSTPITIVVALSRSARNGVLIKGGAYIESLSKTKVFAFDKTGTLTLGHPQVREIITLDDFKESELLQISGSLEVNSKHPIAKAIKEKMLDEKIEVVKVTDFKSITGMGVQGIINGQKWFVGNHRFVIENEIEMDDYLATSLAIMQSEQKSTVIISNDDKVVGILSVQDQIKPHVKGMIHELKKLNIKKTIMLTGDNSKTASEIASELKIDEYYAELLPDQKMKIIDEIYETYGHVAMIGDGINDAPALAHANVGIAMGAKGSDIALETADIALMTDSFEALHYLITISRKAMRVIVQNITLALLIKLVLFVLSYFGWIDLWMAVLIGDMGVSLFVIFNAILRVKGKRMTHEYCDDDLCEIDLNNNSTKETKTIS